MRQSERLNGKVALITGAASGVQGELMGFGGATARLFTREGARVVLTDINDEGGRKTAEEIQAGGGEAMFVHLDVTDEQEWAIAIQTATSAYGKLDILVNNAGTGARSTVEDTTEELWDSQMDVHAKGTFLGTKFAIPEMRKVGGGTRWGTLVPVMSRHSQRSPFRPRQPQDETTVMR